MTIRRIGKRPRAITFSRHIHSKLRLSKDYSFLSKIPVNKQDRQLRAPIGPIENIFSEGLLYDVQLGLTCGSSGSHHELLLRHCEVCTALFTTIVDHMLTLEFDQPDESRMLTVHRCWKRTHRLTSPPSNYFPDVPLLGGQ